MRVGFITTHEYQNFGTFLQCYALQHAIEKLGCTAEVIDYKRKDIHSRSFFSNFRIKLGDFRRRPISYLRKWLNFRSINSRYHKFVTFSNSYLKLSKTAYMTSKDLENNPPLYDVYMSGSDQIWNPNLGGFIHPYFLSFAPSGSCKTAYAPSIGVSKLDKDSQKEISLLLSDFKYISCRELTGIKILEEVGIVNTKLVLDPTLLLSNEEWNELAESPLIKKYALTYFIDETSVKMDIAKNYVKGQFPIVNLTMDPFNIKNSIFDVGPKEFLGLVKNAEMICTDSYHAMLFCIQFHKDFVIIPRHNNHSDFSQNSRIIDFLNMVGLQDRLISDFFNHVLSPIDYEHVYNILNSMKEDSYEYLKKILCIK